MPNDERRIQIRIPAEFAINYIHDGDYLISKTKNISVDGMFIHTEEPPPVGDTIQLTFRLDASGETKINAMVQWINGSKSGLDAGMGVQFIKPPKKLQDKILQYVKRIAIFHQDA